MTLAEYLEREGETLESFGDKIGRTKATVSRLVRGIHKPDSVTMRAIIDATGGAVPADSFYEKA